MSRIHLVVGDTRPQIHVQLKQPDVPIDAPLDVSAAIVLLKFKPFTRDIILFQLTGEVLPGTLQADLVTPDLTQYPIPGSGGRVRFRFIQGNLNLPPGRYYGEIEVVYSLGNTFTLFQRLEFQLREAL